jgi:RNA polymerase sigma factor (sigma-70 family)
MAPGRSRQRGSPTVEIVAMSDSPTTVLIEGLLARLRRGDAAAREELWECAWGRLERLARTMLAGFPVVKGREETGDVLNAASPRILRELQDKTPSSALEFFGWAAKHIRRELIDLARHYRSRACPPGQFPTAPPEGGSDGGDAAGFEPPDDTTRDPGRLDAWTRFHEAVERLPDQQREVFDLLYYQGLSRAEAAELLGVHVKTVRNRWVAARLQLCEELDGEMPGA